MGDVVELDMLTRLDIPVERVLRHASELKSVVVCGWTEDGDLFFSSSVADGGKVLWLLEKAKMELLGY